MALPQQIGEQHFFGIRTINGLRVVRSIGAWQDSSNNPPCDEVLAPAYPSPSSSFCLSFSNNCRLLWFYAVNDNGRKKGRKCREVPKLYPIENCSMTILHLFLKSMLLAFQFTGNWSITFAFSELLLCRRGH